MEFQVARIPAPCGQHLPQPVADGEQDLDAAGPGADDPDAHRIIAGEDTLAHPRPLVDEQVDGLDRCGVLRRPGNVGHPRHRPDVEGQEVVGHRRPGPAQHPPAGEIDAHGLVLIQPRPGEPGQGLEVHVGVVEPVMAGDIARQHARIGGVDVARDQRQPDAGEGLHPEPFEDGHMAVPSPDQDQVLDDGSVPVLHPVPASCEECAANPCVPRVRLFRFPGAASNGGAGERGRSPVACIN